METVISGQQQSEVTSERSGFGQKRIRGIGLYLWPPEGWQQDLGHNVLVAHWCRRNTTKEERLSTTRRPGHAGMVVGFGQ
jgi:hypothetical protein